jgi:hypothetical protein
MNTDGHRWEEWCAKLCQELRPIVELEIRLGNQIVRVDEPAGTLCPFAVIFLNSLHHDLIDSELSISDTVYSWENTDAHYPLESGYKSQSSAHVVAGPLRH